MKITMKGKTAIKVMVDIAVSDEEFVPISVLAKKQGVSNKYLESVIALLVKAGLLESMRGKEGGYKLKKSASEQNIKEILTATGDKTEISSCLEQHTCPHEDECSTISVWAELTDLINSYLAGVSLQDLIDKVSKKRENGKN